ncbi:MAG: ATP-binding protein [Cryomorphaceae bacterium]|nr:ATP-binding protein [Cryomorphaceae bacterium]
MSLQRSILSSVKKYVTKYPILAVTGPRQSGKTTFLKTAFPDYRYVTLENPDTRQYALEDPNGFLEQFDHQVIFDEVQRAPHLFSYLQGIVDANQKMGQFIVSGSQNFQLMENISQSLAGRVGIFTLFPCDIKELNAAGWLHKKLADQMYYGFYPAIYDRGIDPTTYLSDYLQTYVYRDIRELKHIQNLDAFNRFIQVCAAHTAQLVNYNHFSKLVGVSHTTIRQWLSLLKSSYIIFELPPYFNNFKKRLVKSPKLYFYDTGLVCRLLGVRAGQLSPLHPSWGALFENLVVAEIFKQNAHNNLNRDFYYWRDSNGHEVDLLFRDGLHLNLIEIKAGKTIKSDMFKHLDFVAELIPDLEAKKTLIYGGDENQKRTNHQIASWRKMDLVL